MQCDECKREFRPAKSWQRFCNPRCRDTFQSREKLRARIEGKPRSAGTG